MLKLNQPRWRLVVIALVALPLLAYTLACLLIAPIISYKLNDAIASHLHAEVKYDSLSYRFPYSVHLKHVQMFSDSSSDRVPLLEIDRLDLTLAELPHAGKPIVVKNLELNRPTVHLVKTSTGIAGSSGLAQPKQNVPQHKLSEMFELRRFRISGGQISYEDRADPSGTISFAGIDVDLGVTQKSKALYSYHVTANGGKHVNLNADGTIDIDQLLLNVDQFTTRANLAGDAGNDDLPPDLQKAIHNAGVTGSMELAGKATVPLRIIHDAKYSGTLTLHDGGANFGRDKFHLSGLELAATIDAIGAEESVRVSKLQAMSGAAPIKVEPFTVQTADGSLALANVKLTVGKDQWILSTAQLARDPVDQHLLINNITGRVIFASPRASYPGGSGAIFKQFAPIGLYTLSGSANFHHDATTQPTVDLDIQTNGSSATITSYGIPANNIVGEMRLTNTAAQIKHVEADTLDGKISGQGLIVLASPHGYQGQLSANSIDLEKVASAFRIPQSDHGKVSGRGNLSAKFDGKAASDHLTTNSTFTADGRLEITGGQLWQIPVLTGIAQQCNINTDAALASDAAAIFHIENEVVRLDHAAVSSPVLGVQGSGMIGFDKSVDLDVIAARWGIGKKICSTPASRSSAMLPAMSPVESRS